MKVIAAYNIKGGVGKTAAAVNIACLAAADGIRVLLWDLDPQAAASFLFLGSQRKSRLRGLLSPLRAEFDLVVLDCPPGISLLSENVLRAADLLLIPLIPTTLSVRTLDQLTEFVAGLDRHQPRILAFFSMIDRRKRLHREIAADLPSGRTDVAAAAIPAPSAIERVAGHGA